MCVDQIAFYIAGSFHSSERTLCIPPWHIYMVLRFVLFGYRSVSAVTLQGMGKSIPLPTHNKAQPNANRVHNSWDVLWADGRLTARSREVSKPRDSALNLSNRSEIWLAPRQQRCRDTCQISERYDHYNIQSRGSEAYEILRYDVLLVNKQVYISG